ASRPRRGCSTRRRRATWRPSASSAWPRSLHGATPTPRRWRWTWSASCKGGRWRPARWACWGGRRGGRGGRRGVAGRRRGALPALLGGAAFSTCLAVQAHRRAETGEAARPRAETAEADLQRQLDLVEVSRFGVQLGAALRALDDDDPLGAEQVLAAGLPRLR